MLLRSTCHLFDRQDKEIRTIIKCGPTKDKTCNTRLGTHPGYQFGAVIGRSSSFSCRSACSWVSGDLDLLGLEFDASLGLARAFVNWGGDGNLIKLLVTGAMDAMTRHFCELWQSRRLINKI